MHKFIFKHFLPFMLSVTMTVEMIPATAFAQEVQEASEVLEAEETSVYEEEASVVEEDSVEETTALEEDFLALDEEETVYEEGAFPYEEAEPENPVGQLETEIRLADFNPTDAPFIRAAYSDSSDLMSALQDCVFSIYVNGREVSEEINITFQWQRTKTDGVWQDFYPLNDVNRELWENLASDEIPKHPGKYLCVALVDAVDGICEAASLQIPCEINRHKLTVGYDNAGAFSVLPGTKVQDFIDKVKRSVVIYGEDGTVIDRDELMASVRVTVKKKTGETVADAGEVFQNATDYLYSIEPVLKDICAPDYEISDKDADGYVLTNRKVFIGDFASTKIEITDKEGNSIIIDPTIQDDRQPILVGKVYNKRPISIADIFPLIDTNVYYDADPNPDTEAKWELLTDDENTQKEKLGVEWWDSGCNYPLDDAPRDAGSYTLCLTYKGKSGIYKPSDKAFIRVKIKAQEIYIKPQKPTEFICAGMTAQDVISKIPYQVLLKDDHSILIIDPETFWGVAAGAAAFKQAYTPLFQLLYVEQDEAGNTVYQKCAPFDLLEDEKHYIAVFSGFKGTYYDYGADADDVLPINEKSLNSTCSNYDVLVDDQTIYENYVDIELEKTTKTAVDVKAILWNGRGETLENPIVSICNEENIYKDRREYKKAVIKTLEDASSSPVAKDTDSRISYRWQKLVEYTNEDGSSECRYEDLHDTDLNNQKAPYAVGFYRLEIAFSDRLHRYANSTGYVYYEIQPNFVMVEPSGEFTTYSGVTVGEFLNRHQEEIQYTIRKISGNVYKPDAVKGDALTLAADAYEIDWVVERIVHNENGTDSGEYVALERDDQFEADGTYRLMANLCFKEDGYADHYTDYTVVPGKKYRFNLPLVIRVVPMGNIKVKLEINVDKFSMDPTKAGQVYKVYDGESVSITNIAELVTVKDADGQEITDFPKEQIRLLWSVAYDTGEPPALVAAPRDAGSYTLAVSFPGNETYCRTEPEEEQNTEVADICRIGRRELVITPVVSGVIKAGSSFASENNFPLSMYRITGAANSDVDAFRFRTYSYHDDNDESIEVEAIEAFVRSYDDGPVYDPGFEKTTIFDISDNKKTTTQKYQSDMEYYARTTLENAGLAEPYCHNYNIINAKAVHKAVRVGSQIYSDEVNLRVETKENVRRIIPSEGLPYYDAGKMTDVDGKEWPEGNYFSFRIKAPAEFDDPDDVGLGYNNIFESKVLLKNSIAKASGLITCLDGKTGDINIAFPVDSETENEKFEIYWQDGFTEAFEVVLENALLCSDTSKAVLPKSMKFKNVSAKMAVGEMQQLNLTVVKKQVTDVVRVGYSVSDDAVLSVTRNGALTALSTGKATVYAYPIKVVDGKAVRIPGGKKIKAKITVKKVAKPVITKVTTQDNTVTVRYKMPANGYRREFYVLPGERTAKEFENILMGTEDYDGEKTPTYINNDWKGVFAIAPVYGDGEKVAGDKNNTYIRVLGTSRDSLSGKLDYEQEYTVYVRNVSSVRTMYDGSMVEASSAGAVKTFTTAKENVQGLDVQLDQEFAVSSEVDYEVPFVEKTVQVTTYGEYHEFHENQAAERFDLITKELPLSEDEQEIYASPKLSYYVTDARDDYCDNAKQAKASGYTVKIGSRYYYPTKLAAISKKGKVMLKGLGTFRVSVYDRITGMMSSKDVRITADVDAFSGKNGKIKVGQRLDLNTLLVYYEDDREVVGDPRLFAAPKVVLPESFESEESEWYIDDDGMFVARKPGTYKLTITDDVVMENGGEGETTVKVKVSAMEPVKKLKKIFVYDAYAKIKFEYSSKAYYTGTQKDNGNTMAEVDFRVDIRDSEGQLRYSQFLDGDDYKTENGKVREYHYLIDGLSQRSSYTVSVTVLYGDKESKAVTLPIKTTSVPASYVNMDDVYEYVTFDHYGSEGSWYRRTKVSKAENGNYDIDGSIYDYRWNEPECLPESEIVNAYQGVHIETWGLNEHERYLDEYPIFTSGNTYVLRPYEEDLGGFKESYLYPKEAKSDTLIWKVKNSKIAKVKALKGSFSAKLKAAKPGTTILEVKSKNTKKVIARYKIKVKAVGDGHDFFGNYDDYYNDIQWDPTYEKSVESLHAGNPLTIDQADNEYVWVCYEAKESGVHIFSKYGGKDPDAIKLWDQTLSGKNTGWKFGDLEAGVYLYEGMKLYIKAEGFIHHLQVECIPTVGMVSDTLTIDSPLTTTISFTAPEEGCYTFTADADIDFLEKDSDLNAAIVKVNVGSTATPLVEERDYRKDVMTNAVSVLMKQGTTIRMRVKGNKETKKPYTIKVTSRHYTDLSFKEIPIEISRNEDAWFKFTAPEDGGYIFKTSGASATLEAFCYDALDRWEEDYSDALENDGTNDIAWYRLELQSGETRAFRLTADAQKAAVNVSVNAEEMWELEVDKTLEIPVSGNGTIAWAKFEVPETGYYEWNMNSRATIVTEYNAYYRENSITTEKKAFNGLSGKALNQGMVVYITIESLTADKKTFALSVSKVEGKELLADEEGIAEDEREDVTDRQELWYTFTAPAYGFYGFCITKISADGRPITVSEHNSIGDINEVIRLPELNTSGRSVHRVLKEGETVVFKIKAGSIASPYTKSVVSVRVTRCKFVELPEDGAFSLGRDEYGHHTMKVLADGIYNLLVKSNGTGEFDLLEAYRMDTMGKLSRLDGLIKDVTLTGVPLKEGEELYFILKQTGGEANATGTITAKKSTDGGEEEDGIDETVTLDENESRWFSYRVNKDGRYYITASDDCTVEWYDTYDADGNGTPHVPDPVIGDVFKAGKVIYIKVTREIGDGEVFLILERAEPGALIAGSDGVSIKTAKGDHTWYRFTAPETAYYQFDYRIIGGGSGTCKYYESSLATGDYVKTLENNTSNILFMESEECLDFHFYDDTDSTDALMTVRKILVDGTLTVNDVLSGVDTPASDDGIAWYHFEAPENGNYIFEIAGATDVSYFVDKAEDILLNRWHIYTPASLVGTSLPLQKGDKVLLCIAAGGDALEVGVRTDKMWILAVEEPIVDLPVSGEGTVTWIKFEVPESGWYSWKLETDAANTEYEMFYRMNSVRASKQPFAGLPDHVLKKGDIVYITIESKSDDAKNFSLSVSVLDEKDLIGDDNGVAEDTREDVTDGKELWYTFTAPSYGFYEFGITTSDDRTFEVHEYAKVGDTTAVVNEPALEADGNIVHRPLAKDAKVIFKIKAGNRSADPDVQSTVTVKITRCEFEFPGEEGTFSLDADAYGHYMLKIRETGEYHVLTKRTSGSFKIVAAYRADADGELTRLEGLTIGNTLTGVSLRKQETLYFILKENSGITGAEGILRADMAEDGGSISGTGGSDDEKKLVSNAEITDEFADKEELWYSFTAPALGFYEFFIKKISDDGRTITVGEYSKAGDTVTIERVPALRTDGTIVHRGMRTGERVVFKLSASDIEEPDTKTSVSILVKKCVFTEPDDGKFTIEKGQFGHYKLTASESGKYNLTVRNVSGSFKIDGDIEGVYLEDMKTRLNVDIDNTLKGLSMTKGESLYFLFSETGGISDAEGTITADLVVDMGDSAIAGTDIVLEPGESRWLTYRVAQTGRYYITASAASRGYTFDLYDNYNGNVISKPDVSDIVGYIFHAGMTLYIKVTNSDTAQKEIRLAVEKVTPISLKAGEELAGISMRQSDRSWYNFTADEDGYYLFDYKVVGGDESCIYYNTPIQGGAGIGELASRSNRIIYMRENTSFDLHFLDQNNIMSDKKAGIEVSKIGPVTTLKVDVNKEPFALSAVNREAWYYFKAGTAGKYSLEIEDTAASIDVTFFVKDSAAPAGWTLYKPDEAFRMAHDYSMDEEVLIRLTTGSNSATGTVRMISGELKRLTESDPSDKREDVTDGKVLWYSYIAPSYGFYEFYIDKTTADPRNITVTEHENVGDSEVKGKEPALQKDGTVVHRLMRAGEKTVFKIEAGDSPAGTEPSTVCVEISKCVFTKEGADHISFDTGKFGHYMLTAAEDGLYNVLVQTGTGDLDLVGVYKDDLSTRLTEWNPLAGGLHINQIRAGVSIRGFESLYFILERKSATATGSITMDLVKSFGNSGNTSEEVTLDADKSQWFSYRVKQAGRYYISASGVADSYSVLWYDGDHLSEPHELKGDVGEIFSAGKTIYIQVTNKIDAQNTVRLNVDKVTPLTLNEGAAYRGISMKPADHSWYSFKADSVGGYYLFEYTVTGESSATCDYHKPIIDGTGTDGSLIAGLQQRGDGAGRIMRMSGNESFDIHFYESPATDNTAGIRISKICGVLPESEIKMELNKPQSVSLTTAVKEKWYHFNAVKAGSYMLETADATGPMDVTYFRKDKDFAGRDIYNPMTPDATALLNFTDGNNMIFARLTPGADVLNASANALMIEGEMEKLTLERPIVNKPAGRKDTVTWVKFTAPDDGWYDWKSSGTNVQVSYRKDNVRRAENNDLSTLSGELKKNEVVYVTAKSTADPGNSFSLSVSKIDKTLQIPSDKDEITDHIDMTDGQEQWYSFTVPANGFYEFSIKESIAGSVQVEEFRNVGDTEVLNVSDDLKLKTGGGIVHRLLEKDTKVVFKIKGVPGGASSHVAVKIAKCKFTQFTDSHAGISLENGGFGHYRLTAPEDGLYNLYVEQIGGAFDFVLGVYRDELATRSSVWTKVDDIEINKLRRSVGLGKDESLYVILQEKNRATATGSITMDLVTSLGSGGSVSEETSLTTDRNTRWYSYNVQWDGRYYISASGTGSAGCTIELYEKSGNNLSMIHDTPSDETGNVFHKGKTVYIKVTNPAANDVTLHIERVLLGTLKSDSASKHLETKEGVHSWYQFTAPEAGYYLFEYTRSSGDATCKYYEAITSDLGSDGRRIDEVKTGENRVIKMNNGQSFDFHFYDGPVHAGSTGTMKITLVKEERTIEVDGIEDKIYTADLSTADKWYRFVAPANGRYICPTNMYSAVDVQYYVESAPSSGKYIIQTASENSYLNLSVGTNILIRLSKVDSGVTSANFSVIDRPIQTVTATDSLHLDLRQGPVYVRLKRNVAEPDTNYYVESYNIDQEIWCMMYKFCDDAFAGGVDGRIFRELKPNNGDYDRIYKVKCETGKGITCDLGLMKIYNMKFGVDLEATVDKESQAYIIISLPRDTVYVFKGTAFANDGQTIQDVKMDTNQDNILVYGTGIDLSADQPFVYTTMKSRLILRVKNASDTESWTTTFSVNEVVGLGDESAVTETGNTEKEITLKGGESKWFSYRTKQAGRYYISSSVGTVEWSSNWKENDFKKPDPEEGNIFKYDQTIYIKVSNGSASEVSGKVYVERVTPVSLNEGVAYPGISMNPSAHSWYNFTADGEGGNYLFEYDTDMTPVGGALCKYYRPVKDDGTGGTVIDELQLPDRACRIVSMNANESYDLHFYDGSASGSKAGIKVSKIMPSELVANAAAVEITGSEAWYQFNASTMPGQYTLVVKDAAAAPVVTYFTKTSSGRSVYEPASEASLTREYSRNEDVLIRLAGCAGIGSAKPTVRMISGSLKEFIGDVDGVTNDMTDGQELWYSYTAQEYGFYEFSIKDVATPARTLTVKEYENVGDTKEKTLSADETLTGNGSIVHRLLAKDDKVIFKVIADGVSAASSTVSVSIKKCDFTPIESGDGVSIAAGKYGHYRLTADEIGLYNVLVKQNIPGSFKIFGVYRDERATRGSSWLEIDDFKVDRLRKDVALDRDEHLYVILEKTADTPTPEGTITMEPVKNLGSGGSVSEEVSLTADTKTRWYSYNVQWNGRYYIGVSGTDSNECTVELYEEAGNSLRKILVPANVSEIGNVFHKNKIVYIKVTGPAVDVKLNIERVLYGILQSGVIRTLMETKEGSHSWYQFTAPAEGLYQFDYVRLSGSATCKYYNAVTGTSDGSLINEITDDVRQVVYMEKDESLDFHFYATSASSKAGMKITPVREECTISLDELKKNVALSSTGISDVWYKFTAPNDGKYVCITSATGGIVDTEYFVYPKAGVYPAADGSPRSVYTFNAAIEISEYSSAIQLKKDDQILLKLGTANSGVNVDFTITDRDIVTITPSSSEILPLTSSRPAYVRFDGAAEYIPLGTYFVRSDMDNCQMYEFGNTVPVPNSAGAWGIFTEFKPDDLNNKLFIITATSTMDLTCKLERSVKDRLLLNPPDKEHPDGNVTRTLNIDKGGRYEYVTFVVPTYDYYVFEKMSVGDNVTIENITLNDDGTRVKDDILSLSDAYPSKEVLLKRETEVILKISTDTNGTTDVSEEISISRRRPTALTESIELGTYNASADQWKDAETKNHIKVNSLSVPAHSTRWYVHTMETTALYSYKCIGSDDLKFDLGTEYPEFESVILHPTNSADKELKIGTNPYSKAKGDVVYIRVENTSDSTIDGQILIGKYEMPNTMVIDVPTIPSSGQEETVIRNVTINNLSRLKYIYFNYTPGEDGFFDFEMTVVRDGVADTGKGLRYYDNGIKGGNPDAAQSYWLDEKKPQRFDLTFVPEAKTVVFRNHIAFDSDIAEGSSEEITLTITFTVKRNHKKESETLVGRGGKNLLRESWHENSYDVYRYNVAKSGFYEINLYKVDEHDEETDEPYKVSGLILRDQPGETIRGIWNNTEMAFSKLERFYLHGGESVYLTVFLLPTVDAVTANYYVEFVELPE